MAMNSPEPQSPGDTISHTAAIIVAGGRGHRAGDGIPKQYRELPNDPRSRTVLATSLQAFTSHPEIGVVCVVIHKDDVELYKTSTKHLSKNNIIYCFGGDTRQESVCLGLQALQSYAVKHVLIHDAARPHVSANLISRCLAGLGSAAGAIPAVAVTDTLKRAQNGSIVETVSRDGLWSAQTPQAFHYAAIFAAHLKAPAGLTDDAAVAEVAGLTLAIVAGDAGNIKLTHEADFAALEKSEETELWPRTGTGFDVHRLDVAGSAETIWLAGVCIPHDRQLIGHSDADVALHAITDAVLGGLALGDIGDHFPDTDESHKNRPSKDFLSHAVALAQQHHAAISHVDVTIICEQPKIAPHRPAMRAAIADIMGLPIDCVSLKATTTEGLGLTGRGEGIVAQASVTLMMPRPRMAR
ncbi:bifunctional 2-C-methyl-D-erythritol 4-phosphate cytidylyltransferase/2-C-methyl-D-erythritol 2,4-cyclodiphosphate synthase [Alphaproteobacteria bacterium]|nr:bifunctional 2-C-methyl-D-erythritol 4-phosphate cytidylyltransferase/2-C-methyl-D-erythritol 2,4-cyclodiphosphate synthase [Alphaproteobacteria bacterium]